MANIARQSGETWRQAASYGFSQEFNDYMARSPLPPGRGSIVGRVMLEGRAMQVVDVQTDPEYQLKEAAKLASVSTILGVPILREDSAIGVLVLQRRAALPFTDKQIQLAETFADQAAIAIENARLLNQLRQRTDDLTESLDQQTATSEVLSVISSSPADIQP